jgi:carboxyl-terminal processing protease
MKSRFYITLIVALLVANLLVLVRDSVARHSSALGQLNTLIDLRHQIVEQFVEEPNQEAMIEAAIEGMIGSLNDPFTAYLSPEDLESFARRIRGTFSGIGAVVTIDEEEDRLKIISPLEGMPAWQAGVMAGDVVLEVEGEDTKGIDINQAVEMLTGPEGTDVTIKVRHENGETAEITITRAKIVVPTVKGLLRDHKTHWRYMIMPEEGIAYVRITQFTGTTVEDLRQVIQELEDQGVKGMILDLRFNPGGVLEAAEQVSDMFLDEGSTIVSVKGRAVEPKVYKATDSATLTQAPVVILANGASASASEIVTGALLDNGRAQFIGTRTFGKGSVQQIHRLDSGSGAIKITNAYYYLPSGRNLHRRPKDEVWGVDPADGFFVPMSPEQIRQMHQIQREGDIVRQGDPDEPLPTVTPQFVRTKLADPQLAAGIEAMQGYLKSGQWPKVGLGDVQARVKLTMQRNQLLSDKRSLEQRLEQVRQNLAELDEKEKLPLEVPEEAQAGATQSGDEGEPDAQPEPQTQAD